MIERRVQEVKDKYAYKVIVILVDLTSEGGIRKLLTSLEGRGVHVLVNNAGFGLRTPFSDTSIDGLKRLVYLQTTVVAEITHHILKGVKKRNEGTIINISSDGASAVVPGNVTYTTSKRSIATLTEGLHTEFIGTKIRVQVVYPGFVDTDFHENNGMHVDKTRKGVFGLRQPEDVVDGAMKGLEEGKVICIPDKAGKLVKAMAEHIFKRVYYQLVNDFVNKNTRKN